MKSRTFIKRTFSLLGWSSVFAFAAAASAGDKTPPKKAPPKVTDAKLGKTRNVHACGKIFLAGQPAPEDIALMKKKGIKRVITLRTDGEVDWDEAGRVKQAGIDFVQVPFRLPDSLTDEVFDKVRKLLKEPKMTPALLHCGSANRVGAVWLAHRVLDEGVPVDEAMKEARQVGLRTPAYLEKALDYIDRHSKKK